MTPTSGVADTATFPDLTDPRSFVEDIPHDAFARMRDGATSKVVVMNKAAIDRVKKSAQGTDSSYSPWTTNPDAMWLKSAVRQLAKWVPTSAEYIREQMRAARDVAAEIDNAPVGPDLGLPPLEPVDTMNDGYLDLDEQVAELPSVRRHVHRAHAATCRFSTRCTSCE